ncbi:cupin domain-containing protein [Streptomyces sp. G-5]|uniref:cupin domain-containing protein n=1 Tax=Streptomyces sp. G-5 TaxID=2977231 RepID=UPI0021D306B8|nr:cupin domain-containing protein [Streptomyces sp. G-5]MCU4744980.1 cupin domain-containing protein [Streptomyces sp. G-5]
MTTLHNPLPGAVGVSHISAYDWLAADGACGGSPHMHLACTEAYVVTAGEGAVQTLTPDGYTETPLHPGVIAWFTPGTVHRMINGDGALRVTVLMQNSGLPEAGDAVFTFPPEILADPERYAAAAALPGKEGEAVATAARARRDLAIEGYEVLRTALRDGDTAPLEAFHRAAARLVAPKVAEWHTRWQDGALAAARRTEEHLKALAEADPTHLAEARITTSTPTRDAGYGMCGRRQEYEIPGTTLPYYGE